MALRLGEITKNRLFEQKTVTCIMVFCLLVLTIAIGCIDSSGNMNMKDIDTVSSSSSISDSGDATTIVIGHCGDFHKWVGTHVMKAALIKYYESTASKNINNIKFEMRLLEKIPEDAREVDIVVCAKGSTEIIQDKIKRGIAKTVSLTSPLKNEKNGWEVSSDGRYPTTYWPKTWKVLRGTKQDGSLKHVKPFIVKMNTEPWNSQVDGDIGADLMFDTKTNTSNMANNGPTIYLPWTFGTFAMRNVGPEAMKSSWLSRRELLSLGKEEILKNKKTRFCAFMQSYCAGRTPSGAVRCVFFDLMAEHYKPCDALGNCVPRSAKGVRATGLSSPSNFYMEQHNDAVKVYLPYRFVMTFENSQDAGYISEKFANARLANAIPIYWGAPEIAKNVFNPDAFIHCDVDIRDVDFVKLDKQMKGDKFKVQDYIKEKYGHLFLPCINKIKEIEEDDEKFMKMISAPIIKTQNGDETLYPWLDMDFYTESIARYLEYVEYALDR